jgi:hypothetical protein
VSLVLEGAHPLEWDRAADVDVRGGDVDPELDPQRPPERELRFELALREDVNRIAGQCERLHSGRL